MLAAQGIATGDIDIAVAGGMESMSNCPYLLTRVREGLRMGDGTVIDSMILDGLWDSFHDMHMGLTGEHVSETYHVTRQEQDQCAVESHAKAAYATRQGWFKAEDATGVDVPQKKGDALVIDKDEVGFARTLRPSKTLAEAQARLQEGRARSTAGNALRC